MKISNFLCIFSHIWHSSWTQNRSGHPEVFYKKSVLRNFAKFTGKQLCQSLFFKKISLLKKRLWRWFYPVNFTKFLRTPFFREHLRWLLLTERKLNVHSRYHSTIPSKLGLTSRQNNPYYFLNLFQELTSKISRLLEISFSLRTKHRRIILINLVFYPASYTIISILISIT